jgi:hypothetical protein
MISELFIAAITTIAYRKIKYDKKHKGEKELIGKWIAAMEGAGVKNQAEEKNTFEIIEVAQKDYGFMCKVQIPFGKSFDELEKLKPTVETNLQAICEVEKGKFDTFATLKIINNPLNNLKYQLIQTKPYELLLGFTYDGKPYKINMLDDSHLLIGGIRGSGKSRLQFIILTTLLKNHDENEIEVYLMELLKKDLKKFKYLKQIKMFCETLLDSKLMLERIEKMIEKRAEKIESQGVENILDYNKKAKIKMKYIYIFSDEYSLFMSEADDTEEETEYKNKILSVIKKIAKLGRSVGVFFISGLQRSTVTEINSLVKSQMCRCSFSQLSELDSVNIIGIPDAKGLKKQECILYTGNEYVWLKTPFIDNTIINETLCLNEKETEIKEKSIRGGWHIPSPEEWEKIKHDIPEVTYVKKEEKLPPGQMEAPKKPKKRKGGVIPLKEVSTDVNTEG